MEERNLTNCQIKRFSDYLVREEKSNATYEKYLRDVRSFQEFAGNSLVTKELVVAWKKKLMERGYAVRSINSMLASVNSLLGFLGWHDCKVKNIRLQRQTYCAEEKELTKAEYLRLLEASKRNEQLRGALIILIFMAVSHIRMPLDCLRYHLLLFRGGREMPGGVLCPFYTFPGGDVLHISSGTPFATSFDVRGLHDEPRHITPSAASGRHPPCGTRR